MGIDFLTLSAAKGYTEESLQGAGALKGKDGFSPIIEENENNTDKIYKLDITTADSTFTTPNLKGKDGEGSEGGSDSYIDTTLASGSTQTVVTDSRLKTTSIIDLYTSDSTFEYTSMTLADGSLSIEYDELSSDLSAKVVVRNV